LLGGAGVSFEFAEYAALVFHLVENAPVCRLGFEPALLIFVEEPVRADRRLVSCGIRDFEPRKF
jgi:hypothetical protein